MRKKVETNKKKSSGYQLCGFNGCIFIACIGNYGNFQCYWHHYSMAEIWSGSYTEFINWREMMRASHPMVFGQEMLYISDELAWQATKGGCTVAQLMDAYKAKRQEIKRLEQEEIFEFCEKHNLNTKQDHKEFCRGNFKKLIKPEIGV